MPKFSATHSPMKFLLWSITRIVAGISQRELIRQERIGNRSLLWLIIGISDLPGFLLMRDIIVWCRIFMSLPFFQKARADTCPRSKEQWIIIFKADTG